MLESEGIIHRNGEPDVETLNGILDLHVLNTILLRDPSDSKDYAHFLEGVDAERARLMPSLFNGSFDVCIPEWRKEAMQLSGKDQGFYYKILGQGRLYDTSTGDFTTRFQDKYPDKLALFHPG